jgi:TolB-like protein
MNAYRVITPLLVVLFNLWGCTPSFIHIPDPTVYMRKELPPQETTVKLTVLPFESPSYYPEIGMYTSKLFYQQLLKKKEFEVSFSQEADWHERGGSWIGKTELAVEEGRKLMSDYIIIGRVDHYMVGHITSNRVTVTTRLIEVKTGETLYFATGYGSGKPGRTFLLLDLKAGETTPSAISVLYAVVDHIVKDCFKKNGRWGPLKKVL